MTTIMKRSFCFRTLCNSTNISIIRRQIRLNTTTTIQAPPTTVTYEKMKKDKEPSNEIKSINYDSDNNNFETI